MSPPRAPAHRAPHPTSTADNATAPSTPEASRPNSAQGTPAPTRGAPRLTPPTEPPPPALTQRRTGPVDWPAHLARLDELRSETGALPRGALVTLADELGVKLGTVYSQVSRHRRDEALREQGRAAALAQHADPTCSDPESQATDPELIRCGSPSPAPAAAHRVELRCPGCAAMLTLALADPSCSSPAPTPKGEAAPVATRHNRRGEPHDPKLIHSGSPSPAPTLTAADPTPELRQGMTSP